MQVTCPQCGQEVASADVNVQALVAKCAACGQLFGFAEQVPGVVSSPARPLTTLPAPEGFRRDEDANHLVISYRWFTPAAFMLLFFCITWDSFLVFWYFMAFTQNGPLIMKLFPIAHAAIGVLLTWTTLAMFLNTTTIDVDYERVHVRHLPIFWPGARHVPAGEIVQIYCDRSIRTTRTGQTETCNVNVKTIDGRKIRLVSGLDELDKALFIEQEIERFLGIADQHVPGEVKP